MNPKKLGRALVCSILERQVRRLRNKHKFVIVAVVGSIGKTSTKLAIARTLGHTKRVLYQDGNYNDRVTVPLVLFNVPEPNIFNIFAWLKIFTRNQKVIKRVYPYDVVVLELGTDAPGQIQDFAYLAPDIVVISGVSAEHMEFFGTLDAVAAEELSAINFSKQVLVNYDDVPPQYLTGKKVLSYGLNASATYHVVKRQQNSLRSQHLTVQLTHKTVDIDVALLGEQGAKITLAAMGVADMLGLEGNLIADSVSEIRQTAGRMQILSGKQQSILIDDTYNASPASVKAALDVLYATETPQRIAILGSMNEMGDASPAMHREVGSYCNPNKLALVVTIGNDANRYLAPVAQRAGCSVVRFDHPTPAGAYVLACLEPGAVVLAKGSQNGVYAEEALIPLLAHDEDQIKLVRQSGYWKAHKRKTLPPLPIGSLAVQGKTD